MPIYVRQENSKETLVQLAKGQWDLPEQVKQLESWLFNNQHNLSQSDYIVNIGFSLRENALGGGAILSPEAMSIMGSLGMKLYLSEYND